MKFLIIISFIIFSFFIFMGLLPWYSITILAFGIGFYLNSLRKSFLLCFVSSFVLYVGTAYILDQTFDTQLSSVLGNVFGGISSVSIFLLTGLVAALPCGLSGLIGAWSHQLFYQKPLAV